MQNAIIIYCRILVVSQFMHDIPITETFVFLESSRTTSVDVDSSTSNIFYTTHDSIKVFSPKDSTKRSLLPGLSQPDHIALYPAKGYVILNFFIFLYIFFFMMFSNFCFFVYNTPVFVT